MEAECNVLSISIFFIFFTLFTFHFAQKYLHIRIYVNHIPLCLPL